MEPLRYVALGDSYTIGTSVAPQERWPDQLVGALGVPTPLRLVANLAVNGFTSDDVIREELPVLPELQPEFVSLLVGVNDVVRRVPPGRYAENLGVILASVVRIVEPRRMLLVSTPDYTRTPEGSSFGDPVRNRAEIGELNRIAKRAAVATGAGWADISVIADRADREPGLIAAYGLHPSGAQYAAWVEQIAPVVSALLREHEPS